MNIKRIALLALSFTLLLSAAKAQKPPIELKQEYDDQRNLVFSVEYEYPIYGNYTIVFVFDDIRDCNTAMEHAITFRKPGTILTIRPIDPLKYPSVHFQYYWVIPGMFNPSKVDQNFIYRLPFSTAKSAKTKILFNSTRQWGESHTVDPRTIQFHLDKGDTVYASRKGMVCKIQDVTVPPKDGKEQVEYNNITIEHSDGTIASYSYLEKGSIFVKEGVTVPAGTPLGLVGSPNNKTYMVRFSLWYKTRNLSDKARIEKYVSTTNYMDPVFATTEGNIRLFTDQSYTPVVTEQETAKKKKK